MINVSKLKKGIVIDHIRAGHGYKIFQLGLDRLDDVVVLMRNVESTKMGRKD
ncbi:MAG: aspartate carbamoyltransferase regulatory subunit [Eubacteriales bacterium]